MRCVKFSFFSVFLSLGVCLLPIDNARAANPLRALLTENRLDEALALCRQFEVLSTNDTDNLFACAWVYFRSGKYDSAEKVREQLKGKFRLPEFQLLAAYSLMTKKNYKEAERILDTSRTENKGTNIGLSAEELYAENKELQGELGSAAFIYKQVVTADKKRARSHWGLGRYYLARGDNRLAIEHLEQTTKLWPRHVASRFNLGVLYNSLSDVNNAVRWLTEAYRLDKADPGVLEQLGLLFEKKGLIAEAVKYWQRTVELRKDSPIAKEKLATYSGNVLDTLLSQKKYRELVAKLETTPNFSVDPKNLYRRGIAYRNLGKFDKAAGDLRAYVARNPSDPTAARELGIAYLNLQLNSEAESYFRKAANLEPENGMNHAWLGHVLEGKGSLEEAGAEWKKAVEQLKEPSDLARATRRLASVEKRLSKKERKSDKRKNSMEMNLNLGDAPSDAEEP